jgi:hypothetical protein
MSDWRLLRQALFALVPVEIIAALIFDTLALVALVICIWFITWVIGVMLKGDPFLDLWLGRIHDAFAIIAFSIFVIRQIWKMVSNNNDGNHVFLVA